MKNILFLDDDDARHVNFAIRMQFIAFQTGIPHQITHVHTAQECIDALKLRKWNLVSLDHDLDLLWEKPEHQAVAFGPAGTEQSSGHPGDGMEVANFIANHMHPDNWPSCIVIHSHNTECAVIMENILKQAGHTQTGRVEFVPFKLEY